MEHFNEYLANIRKKILVPKPTISLSEYAAKYRFLSPETSPDPGRWRNDQSPYQAQIMDAISNPYKERIVIVLPVQKGKTEIILNAIQYYIDYDPSPILCAFPTEKLATTFSKTRIDPMFRDCPVLHDKVPIGEVKKSENTILEKLYAGGSLTMIGGNSAANTAMRPIRICFIDEVDRLPLSVGDEGSPHLIIIKRTSEFYNRKIVMTSTPTTVENSVIWQEYLKTDQQKFYVPCHECGEFQIMDWSQVTWDGKNTEGEQDPTSARYVCKKCHAHWTDMERKTNVLKGVFRPTAKAKSPKSIGFNLNSLGVKKTEMAELVANYLVCKEQGDNSYRVFVNTEMALPFDRQADGKGDWRRLYDRRENFNGDLLPLGALFLTFAVDVQDDRLESLVCGWGKRFELFAIEHKVFRGPTIDARVWQALDAYLLHTFLCEDGRRLRLQAGCIDSGGHATQQVYSFCSNKWNRNVYAVKGRGGREEIFSRRFTNPWRMGHVKLFRVGVDTAKDELFSALDIDRIGPRYVHFSNSLDEQFFQQIYAEVKTTKIVNGKRRTGYFQIDMRNEALDLLVYNIAACYALGPTFDWDALEANVDRYRGRIENIEEVAEVEPQQELQAPRTALRMQRRQQSRKSSYSGRRAF